MSFEFKNMARKKQPSIDDLYEILDQQLAQEIQKEIDTEIMDKLGSDKRKGE